MKVKEKKLARALRKHGWSLNEIRQKLKVAKSSISVWVRDIELTEKQKQELSKKGVKKEVIEKRRKTRLKNEKEKRQGIINKASEQIKKISKKELKLIGAALYWGEGSKSRRSSVQFSNTDPRAVKFMMSFFREACDVPKEKFRGHIFLHPHLDRKRAERYWSNISGISQEQFFKTSLQQSRASKRKRDTLPYGTFCIQICDVELFLKIKGWIEGIHKIQMQNKNN